MHVRTTTVAAAACGALLLGVTGCSGSSDTPAAAATPSATASSASASPAPSPTPQAPRAIGQTLDTVNAKNGTAATVTVLGYQQGVRAHMTPDEENGTTGYVWAALEIKVCSTKGTVAISRYPWVLAYADGARVEPSGTTYGDFPKPEYPHEAEIKEGDCVRGKTVFAVPGAQRPAKILYTSSVLPTAAEWAVPPQ